MIIFNVLPTPPPSLRDTAPTPTSVVDNARFTAIFLSIAVAVTIEVDNARLPANILAMAVLVVMIVSTAT